MYRYTKTADVMITMDNRTMEISLVDSFILRMGLKASRTIVSPSGNDNRSREMDRLRRVGFCSDTSTEFDILLARSGRSTKYGRGARYVNNLVIFRRLGKKV